ncbi:MAG: diaminopimelate decarboxylase, partial [Synechocystis sp.]
MISTEMPRPATGSALLASPPAPSPNQNIFPLTAAVNAQGHLEIGGCSVPALVEQFGSPLYILDEATLRQGAQQYRDDFKTHYTGESQVIYASKAWSCLAVVAIAAQ